MHTSLRPVTAAAQGRRGIKWLGRVLETHISLPLFALLPLAAIWIATLHFIHMERNAAEGAAREETREQLDTYEAQMVRNLNAIDQTLKVLRYAIKMNGIERALPALRDQGLLPPGLVFQISLVDRDGNVVASNPVLPARNVAGQAYFAKPRDDAGRAPYVSQTMADMAGSDPHLVFSRRVDDAAGRFEGVVAVEVDPAYFTSVYDRARDGDAGLLALAGDDGVARAVRIGDTVSWGQTVKLQAPGGEVTEPHTLGIDGIPRYTATRRLHGFTLSAVVGLSRDEQMDGFERHRANYMTAAFGGSALLILVVGLVSAWSWQLARVRRRERQAQETYAAATEASLDALFVLRAVRGADGVVDGFVVREANSRAAQFTGVAREQMLGRTLNELLAFHRIDGIHDELLKVVSDHCALETEWEATEGPHAGCWLQRQIVPVEGGAVATVRDITKSKQAEQRIRHMALHDELTGLPNRSLIRDRLDHAIGAARQNDGQVMLAFVDLDDFKLVNDGLGHSAGDELLQVVGGRMQSCLGPDDTLGRLGGDEFVILVPDVSESQETLTAMLETIRRAVNEPVLIGGHAVRVSCSMGVVTYPRDGADPTTLMMNADAAMYRAKDLGSNNFQFYQGEMNASVEEKLILLEGLPKALETTLSNVRLQGGDALFDWPHGRFHLLYQPKVDLRTGRIFGVEALIRWHHPEHGLVSPARFIGLAEDSGMIVEIGEWVVRTACAQSMAWRDAGLDPLIVSVNVSARQFEERHLVERIAAALDDTGLPASALELEVTESLIMRDLNQAIERMGELKSMGVSLSIDDFGTGYSSLSALKSFPISTLKIDKSFVRDLATSSDDQAIVLAVISLGHRMDLRVIAEGVETHEQRDFLRMHECDEMQGYLFSAPVPPERIAELLHRQLERERASHEVALDAPV